MVILVRLLAVVVLFAVTAGLARAAPTDGVPPYEQPIWFQWDRAELDILVVPPNHGQIYNEEGPLGGSGPGELTPTNSYLKAMEQSIDAYRQALRHFGPRWLSNGLKLRSYVLGRDEIPQAALAEPEIVVVTDETKGPVLGIAINVRPCIVNNSKLVVNSVTYADMYNIMGQEFGHCLGLGHVGSQGGADPTSSQKHPEHDVMNGFYADPVGAEGNHLHCVSTLDVAGLEWTFKTLTGSGDEHTIVMPVQDYDTTCGGDGRSSPQDE